MNQRNRSEVDTVPGRTVPPKSIVRRLLLLYRPARPRAWTARAPFYLVTFLVLPFFCLLSLGAYLGPDKDPGGFAVVFVVVLAAVGLHKGAIFADGSLRPTRIYSEHGLDSEGLPFTLLEPPRRRPLVGFLTVVAGSLLLATGFYGLGRIADLGLRLRERGRRLLSRDGRTLLGKRRDEPPVLLLRSFDDEELQDPRPLSLYMRRYEESLSRVLDKFGPVITIGRPGDSLSFGGAGRLYVSEEDWQHAVRYFMSRAGVVVIIVGRSEGLWWEISQAFSLVQRIRLLFCFPYANAPEERGTLSGRSEFYQRWNLPRQRHESFDRERQARYRIFRRRCPEPVADGLPEELGKALFLTFTEEGQACMLKPRYPSAVRYLLGPFTGSNIMADLFFHRRFRYDMASTLQPFMSKLYATVR
jgi:hypothetical protein